MSGRTALGRRRTRGREERTDLLLAALDSLLLMASAELAWLLRAWQIDMAVEPISHRWTMIHFGRAERNTAIEPASMAIAAFTLTLITIWVKPRTRD